jgi:hypothetical protein
MKYCAQRHVLRPHLLAASYLLCLLFPRAASAAEDYAAWPKSADVVLNTSASGANVAGTVANFPVLVRLTSANFPFSQADGKGRDIRFAGVDGSPLDYEIERWDSTRSLAEIWVRTGQILGNTAGQTLRMFWGNPAAADSSDAAAVFRSADNFVAAWHLGGSGTGARANAVAGGNAAVPANYDGDENAAGMIAGADSLDGAVTGDYLDVGDGYTEFAAGFTYSVWVYPSAVKKWAHVLDLGNGTGSDNLIVNRVDTTTAMGFHNWNGTTAYAKEVAGQWALNQWQYITVTMTGKNVRMYKNGAQILADTLPGVITAVSRTMNFLGRSNWAGDEYFQGKLDEPELSKTVRSADWIKLAYQNQRASQTLVTVIQTAACPPKLTVPADTSIAEGSLLTLEAGVECASAFFWSIVSGPAPRIIDPESRSLTVRLPRLSGDAAIVYRVTAVFADSTRNRDVRVTVREAVPDPVFTMPDMASWTGKEPVPYRPAITNLAAIKASRDSVLHWDWTFSGMDVQTDTLADGVMLMDAAAEGQLQIKLCLDNGGTPACHTASVKVTGQSTSLAERAMARAGNPVLAGRDALGRAAVTPKRTVRAASPVFPRR